VQGNSPSCNKIPVPFGCPHTLPSFPHRHASAFRYASNPAEQKHREPQEQPQQAYVTMPQAQTAAALRAPISTARLGAAVSRCYCRDNAPPSNWCAHVACVRHAACVRHGCPVAPVQTKLEMVWPVVAIVCGKQEPLLHTSHHTIRC
jgi:hypothetical protein